MITHLTPTYGTLAAYDIETNRGKLAEAWNSDNPNEKLFRNISQMGDHDLEEFKT